MSHRRIRSIGVLVTLAVSLSVVTRVVVAQAAASGKTITGTVVTAEDKPAQQVKVQLFSLKPKVVGPTPRPPGVGPTGDPEGVVGTPEPSKLQRPGEVPIKETTSDANGKFTLTAVAPGPYKLVAGSGRNVAKVDITVKENEEVKPVSLKLPSK